MSKVSSPLLAWLPCDCTVTYILGFKIRILTKSHYNGKFVPTLLGSHCQLIDHREDLELVLNIMNHRNFLCKGCTHLVQIDLEQVIIPFSLRLIMAFPLEMWGHKKPITLFKLRIGCHEEGLKKPSLFRIGSTASLCNRSWTFSLRAACCSVNRLCWLRGTDTEEVWETQCDSSWLSEKPSWCLLSESKHCTCKRVEASAQLKWEVLVALVLSFTL